MIRQPAVAGMFYPKESEKLQLMVKQLLANADFDDSLAIPKAIIAPHAGYIYSGAIAATIFKSITSLKNTVKKVVLLGPAHRVAFAGISATGVDYFLTPLGKVPVDKTLVNLALSNPKLDINIFEPAYEQEHCLEVELPFLQLVLGNFKIAPFLIGDIDYYHVAELLETLWGDNETLIVISSDLSHFYDYATAKKLDNQTSKAIMNLEPEKIGYEQACGRLAIQGLLQVATNTGLTAKVLDLRNSGDTAGSKDSVVGYGAYHLSLNGKQ